MRLKALDKSDSYPIMEPMKHRFKSWHIPWAYSLEEMPFKDSVHEFGIRRKEFITQNNERTRKPYWRKKRRLQKRTKQLEKERLGRGML